jgi:hypothetical protein
MSEEIPPIQAIEAPNQVTVDKAVEARQERKIVVIIIIVALLFLVSFVVTFVLLMKAPATSVAQLRDVFIIFMALVSLFTSMVMVILIIQLARLINLLNNEVKPILESTNETVNNLRGTTVFLSENVVQPVIKLNENLAGLYRLLAILGIGRKRNNE